MLLPFQRNFENVLIYLLYRLTFNIFIFCRFALIRLGLNLSKGIDSIKFFS